MGPPSTLGRERLSRKRYNVNRENILKEGEKIFSQHVSISAAAKPKHQTGVTSEIPPLSSLIKIMTDAYTCIISPPRRTRSNSKTDDAAVFLTPQTRRRSSTSVRTSGY